jgi:hypothetical protein
MPSDARLDQFLASLAEEVSPNGLSGPLLGVWHAMRGEWQAAHDAVQEENTSCAWVHAVLHREEGDDCNAAYWYRLARRSSSAGPIRDEYLAIARELILS